MHPDAAHDEASYFAELFALSADQPIQNYVRYGYALLSSGQWEPAATLLYTGQAYFPNHPLLLLLQSYVHQVRGEFDAMCATAQQAYACAPLPQMVDRAATTQLMCSQYTRGYELYAKRQPMMGKPEQPMQFPPLPRIMPGQVLPSRLMLVGEQGLGDIIMFLRLLPALCAAMPNDGQIHLVVESRLHPLLLRSLPQMVHLHTPDAPPIAQVAGYMALGDVLLYLPDSMQHSIQRQRLQVDAAQRQSWRAELEQVAKARGCTRIIGFSWATTHPRMGLVRTVPLEQWRVCWQYPHILWVNLQYMPATTEPHYRWRAQWERAAAQYNTLYLPPALDAFHDTDTLAHIIAACDGVISAQNATIHLAGALEVPTQALLSRASDWRYGTGGEGCMWYDSVRIHRQQTLQQWNAVLQSAVNLL